MTFNIGAILLGNTVFAFAIAAFVIQNNLVLFILGLVFLRQNLLSNKLIRSFYYSLILGIFRSLPSLSSLADNKLL